MVDLIKGFSAQKAAQAFGVRNTLSSEELKIDPVTSKKFVESNGDLAKTAPPESIQGGLNPVIPKVKDLQSIKAPDPNESLRAKTNVVSFAVNNAFEQPFQRQGDLTKLAGEVGREFDTSA